MNLQLTLVAVFVSVALFVGSLTYVGLERSSAVRRRIRGLQRAASRGTRSRTQRAWRRADDGSDREEGHHLHPEVAEADDRRCSAGWRWPGFTSRSTSRCTSSAKWSLPVIVFAAFFLTMGRSGHHLRRSGCDRRVPRCQGWLSSTTRNSGRRKSGTVCPTRSTC